VHRGIVGTLAYQGEIRWNQARRVRNPETGKKVCRPGAPEDLVVFQAEHLRIVSDELFAAAKRVREQRSVKNLGPDGYKYNPALVRQTSVLSGLLRCSACGSHMIVGTNNKPTATSSGGPRVICAVAYGSDHRCQSNKPYDLLRLEKAALETLREMTSAPVALEAAVKGTCRHTRNGQRRRNRRRSPSRSSWSTARRPSTGSSRPRRKSPCR
jgi:site-specific DNA recombinase